MTQRPASRPDGQIVVIFAVALVAIAMIVGLVVDGGMAFLQRRDGQNDADLAALAGTKVIADAWIDDGPGTTSRKTVYGAIRDRMTQTGCTGDASSHCTWTAHLVGPARSDLGELKSSSGGSVEGSNPPILGVRVDVTRRPRTFFLGLVGQNAWEVTASATAMTAQPTSAPVGQLLPIALRQPDDPFTKGQVYELTPDRIAPGGFAWIAWSSSSGQGTLAASTCVPNNPTLSLGSGGTVVYRAPDDSDMSKVHACLEAWQKSGATVLIPIYDDDPKAPKPPKYTIKGVAAFVVRSLDDPVRGDLRAYFVGTFAYPTVPASATAAPSPGDTLYYLGLVK
jgi:hypothetical protein